MSAWATAKPPLPTLRFLHPSMRERIRAQLEVHDQRARSGGCGLAWRAWSGRVDAFDMDRRAVAGGHPEAAALPAGIAIIDASVEPLGEKAHRIGDAKLNDLSADQGVERIRLVAGGDRHVRAKAEDVVLVDPRVIGILGGAGITLEARPWNRMEAPALGTFVAELRARSIERPLALATVEARDVAAVERRPDDAIAIDVHSADSESGERNLVDFRQRGLGRVRSWSQAKDVARMGEVRSPEAAVER